MRCETCQGTGFALIEAGINNAGKFVHQYQPCPVCNCSGISYCCDEAGANPPNTYEDADAISQ